MDSREDSAAASKSCWASRRVERGSRVVLPHPLLLLTRFWHACTSLPPATHWDPLLSLEILWLIWDKLSLVTSGILPGVTFLPLSHSPQELDGPQGPTALRLRGGGEVGKERGSALPKAVGPIEPEDARCGLPAASCATCWKQEGVPSCQGKQPTGSPSLWPQVSREFPPPHTPSHKTIPSPSFLHPATQLHPTS